MKEADIKAQFPHFTQTEVDELLAKHEAGEVTYLSQWFCENGSEPD